MPCYRESIAKIDSQLQEEIAKLEEAKTIAALILIGWMIACTMTVKIIEEILEERASRITHWPRCPKCGARVENKERKKKSIKGFFGKICWSRKVGRCSNRCEIGQVAPLDEELEIEKYQRSCEILKKIGTAFAVFVPYRTASVFLKLATGTSVSPVTIWNWVQTAGKNEEEKIAGEIESGEMPEPEPIEPEQAQLPMIIGADGVTVRIRPNEGTPDGQSEGKEVKIGVVARLGEKKNKKGETVTKIERKRVVGVLGNIDEFAPLFRLEALRQGVHITDVVVWISDGGVGFWRVFREQFALWAQGVLDFYHAAQNIWKAAETWLDDDPEEARRWFEHLRHILRHGNIPQVLCEILKPLLDLNLPKKDRRALNNLFNYISEHHEHMQYAHLKECGIPIGSGIIESACKWVVTQRFKCVGMRWSRKGLQNLLNLRLAWINGRFASISFC